VFADFHKCEDDLKNDMKNTKEKVRSLEVTLKRAMKEAADSEYDVSQKLAYEMSVRNMVPTLTSR
jgi:hypothetical protein